MKKIRPGVKACSLAAVCAALLAPPALAADWKFSSSFNYDTGMYGGSARVDSVYIPFTFKRYYREGDIAVTASWLRQSSTGRVTRVGGGPVAVSGKSGPALTSAESGAGDLLVNGSYTLKNDGPQSFDLAATGRLKLPTADDTRGLGTGELDEGAGMEFAKEIAPGLTLLVDGYYTIIGDPPGVDLNNELSLDLGISRRLRKDLYLTVLYATRSAIIDGNADPRELSGTLDFGPSGGNHYSCGLLLGLSDGSPETGLSFGFNRKF